MQGLFVTHLDWDKTENVAFRDSLDAIYTDVFNNKALPPRWTGGDHKDQNSEDFSHSKHPYRLGVGIGKPSKFRQSALIYR